MLFQLLLILLFDLLLILQLLVLLLLQVLLLSWVFSDNLDVFVLSNIFAILFVLAVFVLVNCFGITYLILYVFNFAILHFLVILLFWLRAIDNLSLRLLHNVGWLRGDI